MLHRAPPYADKALSWIGVDRLTYSKPLVVENLLDGNPMIYVGREHSLYEIFRRLANGIPEWCLHLQIQLNRYCGAKKISYECYERERLK